MPLRLVSAGAAQGLVAALAAKHAVEVGGSFGAVGAMLEEFLAADPCDVVILTHAQIARLVAEARVHAETVADLGSVATSLAVRANDPAPFVSDAEALRAALRGADAVYFPDPAKATAGIHFAKVIEDLGIRDEIAGRLKIFPNGATAMRAMAEARGHPIGCTQATEILATAGVRLIAPLPRGLDLETVYAAAVSAEAPQPDAAKRFVALLSSESSRPIRCAAGFQGFMVRVATRADEPAIREVVRTVLAEYQLACDLAGIDSDLEDVRASYFDRGGIFEVVIDAQGRLEGCCGVYRLDAKTCELRKMYLLKAARGQGLGGRLLRRALAFARGRGFERFELETASVLKDAIGLYERAGFKPIVRAHLAGRCDRAFALDLR